MAITINNYRELFAAIRQRPRLYLLRPDFASVVAFIDGCNHAHAGTLLTGFQPWLVTRAGCLNNHVWCSIVAYLTEPIGPKNIRDMDPDLDSRAAETLFDLLDEFLELRQEHDGLHRIFAAHEQWVHLREPNRCRATGAKTCPTVA